MPYDIERHFEERRKQREQRSAEFKRLFESNESFLNEALNSNWNLEDAKENFEKHQKDSEAKKAWRLAYKTPMESLNSDQLNEHAHGLNEYATATGFWLEVQMLEHRKNPDKLSHELFDRMLEIVEQRNRVITAAIELVKREPKNAAPVVTHAFAQWLLRIGLYHNIALKNGFAFPVQMLAITYCTNVAIEFLKLNFPNWPREIYKDNRLLNALIEVQIDVKQCGAAVKFITAESIRVSAYITPVAPETPVVAIEKPPVDTGVQPGQPVAKCLFESLRPGGLKNLIEDLEKGKSVAAVGMAKHPRYKRKLATFKADLKRLKITQNAKEQILSLFAKIEPSCRGTRMVRNGYAKGTRRGTRQKKMKKNRPH